MAIFFFAQERNSYVIMNERLELGRLCPGYSLRWSSVGIMYHFDSVNKSYFLDLIFLLIESSEVS